MRKKDEQVNYLYLYAFIGIRVSKGLWHIHSSFSLTSFLFLSWQSYIILTKNTWKPATQSMMLDINSWQRVEYTKICSIFSQYQISFWCNTMHFLISWYIPRFFFSSSNFTVPNRLTLSRMVSNRRCKSLNWPAICKFNRVRRLSKQQKHKPEWTSAKVCKSYRFLKEKNYTIWHEDKKYYDWIKSIIH